MEDDFGGGNDLERRIRRLLESENVELDIGGSLAIQEDISNDQARKLGQFLLDEHHKVTRLFLHLSRLASSRDCEPLLQFIQDSQDLKKTSLCFLRYSNEQNYEQKVEVARRLLQAVAGSSTIEVLEIQAFGPGVPKESFLHLLRETKSISVLQIIGNVARNWPTDDAIENAFVENTTVKTMELFADHSALVIGIIGAMKRSPTIEELKLVSLTAAYSEFSRAVPFFTGLRRLKCAMWPDSIHDAMMKGFKRNSTLVEFSILDLNTPSDIDCERIHEVEAEIRPYLERNRDIRALVASPMVAPQGALTNVNFIPLICPATQDAHFHHDLIYSLLMANPEMFQFAQRRRYLDR